MQRYDNGHDTCFFDQRGPSAARPRCSLPRRSPGRDALLPELRKALRLELLKSPTFAARRWEGVMTCGRGGCLWLRGIVFFFWWFCTEGATVCGIPAKTRHSHVSKRAKDFADAVQLSPFGFPSINYAHPGKGKHSRTKHAHPKLQHLGLAAQIFTKVWGARLEPP